MLGRGNWRKAVQRHKPPVIRYAGSRDVKKGNAKECSNYCTIGLISHASKVMLKILHARLQQYVNCELPDVQAVSEKAEEPEIKFPISTGSWKKHESSRETYISAFLTMPKPLTVWITISFGKF